MDVRARVYQGERTMSSVYLQRADLSRDTHLY